jgi:hypothetical protein
MLLNKHIYINYPGLKDEAFIVENLNDSQGN